MKNNYVLGFAFDESLQKVVLIKKEKPEWQKGKLNGVGGKLEYGESPHRAMVREFEEETGVRTELEDWEHIGTMLGSTHWDDIKWYVDVFCTVTNKIREVNTMEEEEIGVYYVDPINIRELDFYHFTEKFHLGNLDWLIPMAKDYLKNPNSYRTFRVHYGEK